MKIMPLSKGYMNPDAACAKGKLTKKVIFFDNLVRAGDGRGG